MAEATDINENIPSTVVVRDDFFNDPFFSDWWSDFDVDPNLKKSLAHQDSGNERKL